MIIRHKALFQTDPIKAHQEPGSIYVTPYEFLTSVSGKCCLGYCQPGEYRKGKVKENSGCVDFTCTMIDERKLNSFTFVQRKNASEPLSMLLFFFPEHLSTVYLASLQVLLSIH